MELMTHKGHNRVMSGEVTILTPGQGSETSFAADSSWGSTEKSMEIAMEGDNGNYGVTFTVKALGKDIQVTTLDFVSESNSTVNVQVYTRPGLFNKQEMATPDQWTLSADTSVTGYGAGQMTSIPRESFTPVLVPQGQYHTFYLTLDTKGLRYSNATGYSPGDLYTSDKFLEYYAGRGVGQPFLQAMFGKPARIFNGILYYITQTDLTTAQPTPSPILPWVESYGVHQQLETTYQGGTSAYGCYFEVRALQNLVIRSLQVRINQLHATAEIMVWTKSDTYVGYESDKKYWKMVADIMVDAQGPDTLTPIPRNTFYAVTVPAQSIQSFYITLRTSDMILTQDDTRQRGDVFVNNTDIQLLVGDGIDGYNNFLGFQHSILPQRVFNGLVDYSVESTMAPTKSVRTGIPASTPPVASPVAQQLLLPTQGSIQTLSPMKADQQQQADFSSSAPSQKETISRSLPPVMPPQKAGPVVSQQLIEIKGISDTQLRHLLSYDAPNDRFLLNGDAISFFQQTSLSFLQGLVDPNVVKFTDVVVSPEITSKDLTPTNRRRGVREVFFQTNSSRTGWHITTLDRHHIIERSTGEMDLSTSNGESVLPVNQDQIISDVGQSNSTLTPNEATPNAGLSSVNKDDVSPEVGLSGTTDEALGSTTSQNGSTVEYGSMDNNDNTVAEKGPTSAIKKESSVGLYTTIAGDYHPPPNLDFNEVVGKSFNDKESSSRFLEKLKEHNYFANATGISATSVKFPLPKALMERLLPGVSQLTLYLIYAACGGGILLIIILVTCFEYRKRRRKDKLSKAKGELSWRNNQYSQVDSVMEEVYPELERVNNYHETQQVEYVPHTKSSEEYYGGKSSHYK
jgi:hypothetical protein